MISPRTPGWSRRNRQAEGDKEEELSEKRRREVRSDQTVEGLGGQAEECGLHHLGSCGVLEHGSEERGEAS